MLWGTNYSRVAYGDKVILHGIFNEIPRDCLSGWEPLWERLEPITANWHLVPVTRYYPLCAPCRILNGHILSENKMDTRRVRQFKRETTHLRQSYSSLLHFSDELTVGNWKCTKETQYQSGTNSAKTGEKNTRGVTILVTYWCCQLSPWSLNLYQHDSSTHHTTQYYHQDGSTAAHESL